jgi:pectate lyase
MKSIVNYSLFIILLLSCENKDPEVTSTAPVITFAEERLDELPVGEETVVSGTVTANPAVVSIKYIIVNGTAETALKTDFPNSTEYAFSQIFTPTTATTGFKVVAVTKNNLETTKTLPVTVVVTDSPDDPDPDDPNPDDPDPDDPDPDDPYTPPAVGVVELDKLYGWATADGGTTGGVGGSTVHHFNDGAKFGDWLLAREKAKSTAPAVVWLSGTFTKEQGTRKTASSPWYDIKRTSNITIIGTDNFRMQNIGFFLNEASNIIIRNVYIIMPKADNGADGISMQESHNVWVDHCTFESVNSTKDYEDGSCDITHETYNVTVSWCHYIKTQKSSLVGHSNNASADAKITVTFHHNYFDLSNSRHPRVRFGRVHVYNNFFNRVSTYGVGSAYEAKVLVEQNYFDGVHLPTDICTYPAKSSGSNLEGNVAGYLYATDDNVYVNKPSNASNPYPFTNVEYKAYNNNSTKLSPPLTYNDFKPSYEYVVDPAGQLVTIVPNGAGVGKLGYQNAPVAVDNGS